MDMLRIIILLLLIFLNSNIVQAETPVNKPDQVFLEFENLDWAEPTANPTEIPIKPRSDTILYGLEREKYNKEGYVLRSALPGSQNQVSLRTSLSSTKAEFKNVTTDEFVQKETLFTVSSPETINYQVLLLQESAIQNQEGTAILPTKCDFDCSPTYARLWKSAAHYGFGYRVSGATAPRDFYEPEAYRPLPQKENGYLPIMSRYVLSEPDQSILRFKLNVPPSYQENTYAGMIRVITLPKP